jgi:FkbM family methyltransferase
MTFIDVGANIGYFTLIAAALVGSEGKVIAFEPSHQAHSMLESTINFNQIKNITAVQAGLSDSSSNLQLFIPPASHGNHSPSLVFADGWKPINVEVFRLDKYLADNLIDCIDLIKIDVEGFEPNVIRGMSSFLKDKKVKAILIEFNQYWLNENNSSSRKLYDEIIDYGFNPVSPLNENLNLQNIFFTLM